MDNFAQIMNLNAGSNQATKKPMGMTSQQITPRNRRLDKATSSHVASGTTGVNSQMTRNLAMTSPRSIKFGGGSQRRSTVKT